MFDSVRRMNSLEQRSCYVVQPPAWLLSVNSDKPTSKTSFIITVIIIIIIMVNKVLSLSLSVYY